MTSDVAVGAATRGLTLGLVSAVSFGLAGPVGGSLLQAGWSSAAVVVVRLGVAAIVLTPMGLRSFRGRWAAFARRPLLVGSFGPVCIAGAQFAYFCAVADIGVGPATLIESAAPVIVIFWIWGRTRRRPPLLTLGGAALTLAGLALVLDPHREGRLSLIGVAWALIATAATAAYFLISAAHLPGIPSVGLAWLGLASGAVALAVVGAVGLMPLHTGLREVTLAAHGLPWWAPVVVLAVVTGSLAYGTGVAAGRYLGAGMSSLLSAVEVVAALAFAWVLLAQSPDLEQLFGGSLVVAGVILARLGERNARPA